MEADLDRLKSDAPYAAFIHFNQGRETFHREVIADHGLDIGSEFDSVDVYYAAGTVADFRAAARDPRIAYLEPDEVLEFHGDTAPWATRARVAYEPALRGPYFDEEGDPVDGTGIGVAVVDSGIFSAHPDLLNRVAGNWKVVCSLFFVETEDPEICFSAFVDSPMSDQTSGHGTHVAGIVAGDGSASQDYYRGVAPGATLYGFGTGEVISVLFAAEAFDFIVENHGDTTLFPTPVRVVNNSWGSDDILGDPDVAAPEYNPNDLLSKLTKELIGLGITVVYSAGNGGGTGSVANTSPTCKDPTPGVICVANYDDLDWGTRSGALDGSSSRGQTARPSSYPDISAPGTFIESTCMPFYAVCHVDELIGRVGLAYRPFYFTLTGTSMAAPHLSGMAALLLQARPELTPAAVEDVLLDSAHKFGTGYETDDQNPGETTSFDKGSGLADLPAALDALGVANSGLPEVGTSQHIATDSSDPQLLGAMDITSVDVTEVSGGLRYGITVRDAAQRPPIIVLFRLTQIVNAQEFFSQIQVSSAGVAIDDRGTADPTSVEIKGNTIEFFVPFSALVNPPGGTPVHGVWAMSVNGQRFDQAPGNNVNNSEPLSFTGRGGREFEVAPTAGDPYTIVRDFGLLATTTTITSEPTAQYGDGATVTAEVVDANGDPVVGLPVTFTLASEELTDDQTDDSGVATVDFPLTGVVPGPYDLTASFAGVEGQYLESHAAQDFEVTKEAVNVVFTDGSAVSGRYSDPATLSAVLTEDDGPALVGETLSFDVAGATGEGQSDASGTASADVVLAAKPGSVTASASFPGSDLYEAGATSADFEILHELTVLTLEVTGKPNKRELTATLTDDEGNAVANRIVTFFADGVRMGIESTDANGRAKYTPAKEFQKNNTNYSASFGGDDFYGPSSSDQPPPQALP